MKNNRLKLVLIVFGVFIAMIVPTDNVMAQSATQSTIYCKWDASLMMCLTSAPDGYCAYSGPDCTTTITTVEG